MEEIKMFKQKSLYFDTAELIYIQGALETNIAQYEKGLERTKRDHPGCEQVYVIALNNLYSSLKTVNEALKND
jgi:hypothetical protein